MRGDGFSIRPWGRGTAKFGSLDSDDKILDCYYWVPYKVKYFWIFIELMGAPNDSTLLKLV